ncbi:hypothetical protein KC19_9G144300 [Ceratodon purpureus]|uniref:NERD domain-containing protein n=1 Tax=Ceratodon purpureus TaxID=3225 RepID=A0A8T0GV27_CERPU|nr:hypothetical protein KC19_9G144300 [Ceratodon purpureus]
MSRRSYERARRRYRRSSCGALAVAVRVSIFGAAAATALALFRRFRSLVHDFVGVAFIPELENDEDSESNRAGRLAELRVAKLFEGIPGVEVYQSLRIPDPEHRGRREIDIVLLTKRDLFVLEVKNWSGSINLNADGSWIHTRSDGSTVVHSNLLEDLNYRADLLESYIERRGTTLPAGFIQQKVFLVSRDCRPEQAITMQREVITNDQWEHFFNNNLVRKDSGWLKNALSNERSEKSLSEYERKQLHYILSTAPTWDRLELEGGTILVGEFQGFKGRPRDTQTLSFANRSAVSQMVMTHRQGWINNIFGSPNVLILVTTRDYRDGNVNLTSTKQRQESNMQTRVRSETEVVFQIVGTSRPQHFRLSEVLFLSLSP